MSSHMFEIYNYKIYRNDVFIGNNVWGQIQYIDYDLQFEKSYIDPIKTVLDVIGWKHDKTSSLEGFFE